MLGGHCDLRRDKGGEIVADFVQTMKDWRRMCETIQSENQKTSTGGWCKGCPIQGYCVIDTAIKESTNGEFSIIGDQIQAWAAKHQEPVYPTWIEWFQQQNIWRKETNNPAINLYNPIPADIAEKLGLQPK